MRTLGAGASVPSGYLECDGSAVSRTTYADLFAVIGTTYGVGDGSTTFNLPYGPRRTGFVDDSALSITGTNTFALSSAAARAWCNEDGEWFAWVKLEGTKTFNSSGVVLTFGGISEFETQSVATARYNESNPNAELAYTSAATQITCTPPGSNSNVLYVTGEFRLTGEPSWAAANLLNLPVIKI
ncbi:MAG: phage tail protein [Candidatus Pacearchaeota archaeon]|nr:phage tail protein [Candidatus Pacearchaeota archaeon]